MDLEHNAGEVAAALDAAAAALADLEATNAEAAELALGAVNRETPVRTGRLAAGNRAVAEPFGFAYSNATNYAPIVNARTGFASDTLNAMQAQIAAVYENHVAEALAGFQP